MNNTIQAQILLQHNVFSLLFLSLAFCTMHQALSTKDPVLYLSPVLVRGRFTYIFSFSVYSMPSVVIISVFTQGTRRCMAARGTCCGAGGVVQGMEGGRCCCSDRTFRWPWICFTAGVQPEACLLW